jgi:formylmethanofuran dehydrogenase subunit A
MKTIEIQEMHMAFYQIIALLDPKEYGTKRNKIIKIEDQNIERLKAYHFNLSTIKVGFTTEKGVNSWHKDKEQFTLTGSSFEYKITFDEVLDIWKRLKPALKLQKEMKLHCISPVLLPGKNENGYNKSNIMKNAWIILRNNKNLKWSTCLKMAWQHAKELTLKQAA